MRIRSSSSSIKTLIHNIIICHVYPFIARSLNKARSILLRTSKPKHNHNSKDMMMMFCPRDASDKQRNMLFGSFRLHYNWGSSHCYVPAPDQDSLFSSVEFLSDDGDRESKLSGYLEWLDEKGSEDDYINGGEENEKDIDRLADKFIASCHEKFLLEKVESDRRFQEMMARSL